MGCGVSGGALRCDVAFNGEGELCEVGVADDLPELSLGLEHPAAVHLRHISPDCQRLTLRGVRRMISIIDSIGFVEANVFFNRPWIPRRMRVRVSSRPSARDAAAPGWECCSSPARVRRPSSASA